MESIKAFAQSDVGLILGGVFVLMGIMGYAAVQLVILPKLRAEPTKNAARNVAFLDRVSKFEFIAFCVAGSTLLYLHFRG